jgi:hypothetical protein
MSYISVLDKKDAIASIEKTSYDILNILELQAANRMGIEYSSSYFSLTIHDTIQTIMETNLDDVKGGLCIRNLILETIAKAESISPGAGFVAGVIAVETYKASINNKKKTISMPRQKFVSRLFYQSKKSDLDLAQIYLTHTTRNKKMSSIVIEACKMVGSDGQLSIELSDSPGTSIEATSGYRFPSFVEENFLSQVRKNYFSFKHPKIAIIDGIIESEGEIHKLIHTTSVSKETLILICRGINSEVIPTLSQNYLKGTLNIIPIIAVEDINTLNILADIAAVSNSDIVSSFKGDLISSLSINEMRSIDEIRIVPGKIIIKNKSCRRHIQNRIQRLMREMKEDQMKDKKDLITKRIIRLSSSLATVKLCSKKHKKYHLHKKQFYAVVGSFKDICKHGIIDLKSAKTIKTKNESEEAIQKFIELWIKNVSNLISPRALDTGIACGISGAKSLKSVGAILINN